MGRHHLQVIWTVCGTPLEFHRFAICPRGGDRFAVLSRDCATILYHAVGVKLRQVTCPHPTWRCLCLSPTLPSPAGCRWHPQAGRLCHDAGGITAISRMVAGVQRPTPPVAQKDVRIPKVMPARFARHLSIKVLRLEGDPGLDQHLRQFLAERFHTMMFLLLTDVLLHRLS
jgi:hypothetical protein